MDKRQSTAISPFSAEKGNSDPEEEVEEHQLAEVSEKSSDDSNPQAKNQNEADCSLSEDGKVLSDDGRRRTINES